MFAELRNDEGIRRLVEAPARTQGSTLLLAIGLAIGIPATMAADRCISTALYVIEPNGAVGRYSCAGW